MRNRIIILIVLAVALIGIGIAALAVPSHKNGTSIGSTNLPDYRKTGDAFMQNMLLSNNAATYGAFSDAMKNQISSDDWATVLNRIKIYKKRSVTFKGYGKIIDSSAGYKSGSDPHLLQYTVTLDKVTTNYSFVVFKQSNKWYIDQLSGSLQ